jgi:hypothetical protein
MNRRQFLATTCSWAAFAATRRRALFAGDAAEMPARFRLSASGCGRATGYAETNKIVTWDRQTHVAWLDSVAEGFRVRIRTLDRQQGTWSPTYTLGEAHDNHGGPALAVDSRGHLHAVYYPHHHPFRYRRSTRPNDASEWDEEIQFGERCTYPTLVCGRDDTLYLTCRHSYSDRPWQMELWTKPPNAGWQGPVPVARSRHPGYAHFQESLAFGPDRRTLHLCCRFHEKTDRGAYGRIQTVGYMASRDFGKTWQRSDGASITMPATAETIEVLETGGVEVGRILRAGALAVDSAGTPHLIYSVREDYRCETFIATPRSGSPWIHRKLSTSLPERFRGRQLAMPGGMTFDRKGHLIATATIQDAGQGEQSWGHPTSEVIRFCSTDGGRTFSARLVSQPDASVAHWLPNIEKPTGRNAPADPPGIIYTAGPPGTKNTDILANGVYWVG